MENKLRKLQLEMLEMLKLFSSICDKYGIKYSLEGGTLLGAVRHGGFIPWDDDLDVFMLRSEYDKFLKAWEIESPKGYFLQNKDVEMDYTRSFSKIRKENTTFLQGIENPHTTHTGIFIDIFPVDRVPKNKLGRMFFYWDCLRYELYCREFVPKTRNIFVKIISEWLLNSKNREARNKARLKLYKNVTRYNTDETLPLAVIETVQTMQNLLNPDLFAEYTYVTFENEKYMSVANWDYMLTKYFGDYMKLPPIEEQTWKHQPKILNFEYDYENYILSMQKGYTK